MTSSPGTKVLDATGFSPLVQRSRMLSLFIFAVLLILITLTPIPYGTVQRTWESVFEVSVFILAAFWLIDALTSRSFLSRNQWQLLLPLVAVAIYARLQTLISSDPYETQLVAIKLLALTLVLAMVIQYTNSKRRLSWLVHAVIMVALISAVFGIVRQLYQFDPKGFLLPSLQKGSGYAQFINRNHFAFLAEMAFGLIAGLIAGRGIPWPRQLVYVAVGLPIWTALILSNSRGGILAITSPVVFFILASNIGRAKLHHEPSATRSIAMLAIKVVLSVALVVGIVLGMLLVGGEPLADRLGTTRDELSQQPTERTHADRASIWKATLRLGYEHPITGVGFGGYWTAITRYHNGSGELVPQQAHNDYLELWASGGIIGLILFLWFAVLFVRQAYKQLQSPDRFRRAVALGALTGLFGIAVHSLGEFGLHLTGNALICMALITLATRDIPD